MFHLPLSWASYEGMQMLETDLLKNLFTAGDANIRYVGGIWLLSVRLCVGGGAGLHFGSKKSVKISIVFESLSRYLVFFRTGVKP